MKKFASYMLYMLCITAQKRDEVKSEILLIPKDEIKISEAPSIEPGPEVPYIGTLGQPCGGFPPKIFRPPPGLLTSHA
jgi:hypothetical protein